MDGQDAVLFDFIRQNLFPMNVTYVCFYHLSVRYIIYEMTNLGEVRKEDRTGRMTQES